MRAFASGGFAGTIRHINSSSELVMPPACYQQVRGSLAPKLSETPDTGDHAAVYGSVLDTPTSLVTVIGAEPDTVAGISRATVYSSTGRTFVTA